MIPKIIHLTWKNKDLLNHDSPMIEFGMRQLQKKNPDYDIIVNDDDDIDRYLRNVMDVDDYELIKDLHIVGKSDIWRLYKIYNIGGVYVDIDRFCNVSFNQFVKNDTTWVLPTCLDFDFSHDFMMSGPGNPAFLSAIELYLERRREGHDNTFYLGPQTYMHAVTQNIMGCMIDTDPGIEVFTEIRSELRKYPFIVTYRESPPYDTILYRDYNSGIDHESMKRQLYKDFELRHWTGQW